MIKEKIVKEDGKIYEILVGEQGNALAPYNEKKEEALFMGPFLIKEKNKVFVEKWESEQKNFKNIFKQLERATETEETKTKRAEVLEKIRMIEEVLS